MAKEKTEVIKMLLTPENIKKYIDLLHLLKMPFTMEISNYTQRIKSNNYNVLFLRKEMNLKCFAAAAKIKKDLLNVKNPPRTKPESVTYYETNFRHDFYADTVHNIDLKSAYATILFNDGFITHGTYQYLCSLDKMDRLASVGMCASRKQIFSHDKYGKVKELIEIVNPLASFFFYCVQKTALIIHSVRVHIFQQYFLFSWVDSIYYINHNDNYRQLALDYIKDEFQMESSFTALENFELKTESEFYNLTFTEVRTKKNKSFNIPFPVSKEKKQIINYLLLKNYK